MSEKKIKSISLLVFIILLLGCIALFAFNCIKNTMFFNVSISSLINIFFVLIIGYYLTQKLNQTNKLKEQAEKIVVKIVSLIEDNEMKNIDNNKKFTLVKRKLGNLITLLKESSKVLNIEDDVNYIDRQFKAYSEFVGDHIYDETYMAHAETKAEIAKYLSQIDDYCSKIMIHLYK